MNTITKKQIIVSWLKLILLTLLSVLLSLFILNKSVFIGLILLIVLLKGLEIIDIFMALRFAPTRWRILLMSYAVIIPLLLLVIYIF